jgi:AcrR family transcriptional regulator
MKPANKAARRPATPKLTRDDWLDAAYDAVVEGGFDNVRVLVLADTLGVTRGSFYWHFAGHADLIAALLGRWREREIGPDRRLQSESTADPEADLTRLLDAALAHAGADLADMRFELAVRGLGRRDPEVAKLLVEVDQARVSLFEHAYRRLTGDPKAATELAALFYLVIAGSHQALSRPSSSPRAKAYLTRIIADYLIHRQSAAR